MFVFLPLHNLFSISISLDDSDDYGNSGINKIITNTGNGSFSDSWNFSITGDTSTTQLETGYWYNEGSSGSQFRLKNDHGAYLRANSNVGVVGTALFASVRLGANYSFTATSSYSITLYHSKPTHIRMDDNSGVRLAVQENNNSWYVSDKIYEQTGKYIIYEGLVNSLSWYSIDPSNYNTSEFELDTNTSRSFDQLENITNVGVYLYANIENIEDGAPSGFNWGVQEFRISGLEESTPIPEPSTHALILGCFSIILVIYTRRKN